MEDIPFWEGPFANGPVPASSGRLAPAPPIAPRDGLHLAPAPQRGALTGAWRHRLLTGHDPARRSCAAILRGGLRRTRFASPGRRWARLVAPPVSAPRPVGVFAASGPGPARVLASGGWFALRSSAERPGGPHHAPAAARRPHPHRTVAGQRGAGGGIHVNDHLGVAALEPLPTARSATPARDRSSGGATSRRAARIRVTRRLADPWSAMFRQGTHPGPTPFGRESGSAEPDIRGNRLPAAPRRIRAGPRACPTNACPVGAAEAGGSRVAKRSAERTPSGALDLREAAPHDPWRHR